MQFDEGKSKTGKCPICGKPVLVRTTRGIVEYCSRACRSMIRYATRYIGTGSGKLDRPNMKDKTKLPL